MPRPSVFTEQVLQKLEEAFALDCTDEEACVYADIASSSLYNYQNENEEFLERKQLLRQRPILKARTELVRGLEGNPNLALKYLERKRREEFGVHTTARLEMKVEKNIEVFDDPEKEAARQECLQEFADKLAERLRVISTR